MADILYDDLQQLAAMKFHVGLLHTRAKRDRQQQATATGLDRMLKAAVETSRSLSHELSPAILYQKDMVASFRWLAGKMRERHGLLVRVAAPSEVNVQSDAMKAFLYKAGQEMQFNVIKHAKTGEATIRLRRFGPCVCLSVSDRGRGFDPQGLKETTGFGLFSLRERVELLGGRMKIRNVPGKGSTLSILVPDGQQAQKAQWTVSRRHEAVGTGPLAHPASAEQKESPLRVLLADDHEVVRHGLRAMLDEAPDVEIVGEAANGREAVNPTAKLEPDVVIMDVAMPLIDGEAATRQIKRYLPKTRVIALSMYDEPQTVARMHSAGAEAYVLKTASSEELFAAIRGR